MENETMLLIGVVLGCAVFVAVIAMIVADIIRLRNMENRAMRLMQQEALKDWWERGIELQEYRPRPPDRRIEN